MLVVGFPTPGWGTNCYLVAPGPGEECVIVDPGMDAAGPVDELLAEHRLRPVAVMLTHGHLDHTFSVGPVCGAKGVPAWIHPEDREMLADPAKAFSADLSQVFGGRYQWTEPDDVRPLDDGEVMRIAGLEVTVDHAPGHTRGSVMFRTPAAGDVPPICLSGDVLFQGSIGRTDLPGGDYPTMLRSLAEKVLPLPDETIVLPGHGEQTTVGLERRVNPFLAEATPLAGPARGL